MFFRVFGDFFLFFRFISCFSVKYGDEWGEFSRCESGDSC